MSKMQDRLPQLMQLIKYCHVSSFSTVITNHHSIDGYEAMGFDITQLTQYEEQSLFTIKTNMPIPMLVYGDSFQWEKYGHHILQSNLDLTSHNKASLHRTFWNSLIEFLCTDLDGNLSSTLNPLTASKLDHYLSTFLRDFQKLQTKAKFLINIC
jgi:hypothetical protein